MLQTKKCLGEAYPTIFKVSMQLETTSFHSFDVILSVNRYLKNCHYSFNHSLAHEKDIQHRSASCDLFFHCI